MYAALLFVVLLLGFIANVNSSFVKQEPIRGEVRSITSQHPTNTTTVSHPVGIKCSTYGWKQESQFGLVYNPEGINEVFWNLRNQRLFNTAKDLRAALVKYNNNALFVYKYAQHLNPPIPPLLYKYPNAEDLQKVQDPKCVNPKDGRKKKLLVLCADTWTIMQDQWIQILWSIVEDLHLPELYAVNINEKQPRSLDNFIYVYQCLKGLIEPFFVGPDIEDELLAALSDEGRQHIVKGYLQNNTFNGIDFDYVLDEACNYGNAGFLAEFRNWAESQSKEYLFLTMRESSKWMEDFSSSNVKMNITRDKKRTTYWEILQKEHDRSHFWTGILSVMNFQNQGP